jgi:hypothetical protein
MAGARAVDGQGRVVLALGAVINCAAWTNVDGARVGDIVQAAQLMTASGRASAIAAATAPASVTSRSARVSVTVSCPAATACSSQSRPSIPAQPVIRMRIAHSVDGPPRAMAATLPRRHAHLPDPRVMFV